MAEAQPSQNRDLILDCDARVFRCDTGEAKLTPLECDILQTLCLGYPHVVSDAVVERSVWGARCSEIDHRLLDVLVCQMRKSLGTVGYKGLLQRTRSLGWRVTAPVQIKAGFDPIILPRTVAKEIAAILGRNGSTRLQEVILAACA
jgi:DNA-binding response OmpR family regulator